MRSQRFEEFFKAGSPGCAPYPYQVRLADAEWPETLLVPTGFGKTAAVLAAWLWKRARHDPATPRRLIYCLPMRTLVEQTERVAGLWAETARRMLGVDAIVALRMGGRNAERWSVPAWMSDPMRPAIVVGTQDFLVSAALMRGYGTTRYRWPVDFALLHNDALWVFDEVQLMGAALATSAQLEAFRRKCGTGVAGRSLWISATLDPRWLRTVDFSPADRPRRHDLSSKDIARAKHLWAARKTLRREDGLSVHDLDSTDGVASYAAALARRATEVARPEVNTILFLNTVPRAQAVYDALAVLRGGPDRLLVHARFRQAERERLAKLLSARPSARGRILVATQALEAGVDVTSAAMFTELAPWSSLVQRFGRCNRYGECGPRGADLYWIDLRDDAKGARPYRASDLGEARQRLLELSGRRWSRFSKVAFSAPPREMVVRRRDVFDLFDTEPDLSGFEVDISPFVRQAEDTDVHLFWRPVKGPAPASDAPLAARREICPVHFGRARRFLKRGDVRAWWSSPLSKEWRPIGSEDVFPGMEIWIDSACGGYDPERGFSASATGPVEPVAVPDLGAESLGDDPDADATVRVSLAKHSVHVRREAKNLAEALRLGPKERDLIVEAALWHDLGKAHAAFVARTQNALDDHVRPPLAKWPIRNGESRPRAYRKHFRHELASALAYLANHEWAEDASLAAYLIAAHHGKLRMRIAMLPGEIHPGDGRLFARGVWNGDVLPETSLGDVAVPRTPLNLDLMQLGEGPCGASWSARTQRLLRALGPFRLAWLEALVRIADWRASAAEREAGHDDL